MPDKYTRIARSLHTHVMGMMYDSDPREAEEFLAMMVRALCFEAIAAEASSWRDIPHGDAAELFTYLSREVVEFIQRRLREIKKEVSGGPY